MKSLVLLLALAAFTTAATAQLRTIPKDAKLGELRHLQQMMVEIDGKAWQLSPGAQIRDADNRLVLPTALAEKSPVRYQVDHAGLVAAVRCQRGRCVPAVERCDGAVTRRGELGQQVSPGPGARPRD